MELTNSKRLLYTASYVTTQLTPEEQRKIESKPGGGYPKANALRSLGLNSQDLDRLWTAINAEKAPPDQDELKKLFAIAKKLAEQRMPMPDVASVMASISYDVIMHFIELASTVKNIPIGTKIQSFVIEQRRKISPIGRIHLERIEMYPAGVQKGELVFTVPMAGGETVTISHKEWSTSTREFEEIVQDFFESYSEQGVAEKTDTAMSSENEAKHSSVLNFGATLTGSYGSVTQSTTLGIANTNEERQSVKQSMQKNREVTEKASARTRKEHKVSMKIETKTGTEERSAKTITNNAMTPIRIDYYRMMRKWRTDLFRYGLRQTYDIAMPLPGVRLWALHQQLAELDKMLGTPFSFSLKAEDLNNGNWAAKAIEFGAPAGAVPPPPEEQKLLSPSVIIDWIPENQAWISRFGKIDFEVPAGYKLSNAEAIATLDIWETLTWGFEWLNGHTTGNLLTRVIKGDLADLKDRWGAMSATYSYTGVSFGSLTLLLTFGRKLETLQTWQQAAWVAIKNSAEARYHEQLARVQEERDKLWHLLNGKDTLSLRRLEREELLRLVMQWLLGPDFPVVSSAGDGVWLPAPVYETMNKLLANERDFITTTKEPLPPTFNPTFSGITEDAWFEALGFGEFVKFIHQAVEWENLMYFLYPYFWGSETLGRDKLLFEHSDPEHERFLRAGYARIVLTVRPGFEEEFTNLIETGTLSQNPTSPYIPIAQEIANFARTNYAGIPPANPELHARPLLYPEQRATWDVMQDVMKNIDAFKTKNGHYPAKLDDLPSGLPVDAWGNPFVYRLPGLGTDYDLVSLGADNQEGGEGLNADISSAAGASLVATWFDYTPTSALDIEVDTKPGDIA